MERDGRMSGALTRFSPSERSRGSMAFSSPVAFRLAQNRERQEHCGREGSLAGEEAESEEKGEDNEFAIR